MDIASIAEQLGVHPNTVRFHLDTLLEGGQVERLLGDRRGAGRPPIVYRMSRAMDRNGPSNYRLLAAMLTSHLARSRRPMGTATRLARSWGPSVVDSTRSRGRLSKTESLTELVDVLADLGFEPEPHRGARSTEIRLRHCPFLDLVDAHGSLICALHLGLMQGAFAALDSPVTVDRLDPFVEPDLCVAHLGPNTDAVSAATGRSVHRPGRVPGANSGRPDRRPAGGVIRR